MCFWKLLNEKGMCSCNKWKKHRLQNCIYSVNQFTLFGVRGGLLARHGHLETQPDKSPQIAVGKIIF